MFLCVNTQVKYATNTYDLCGSKSRVGGFADRFD